MEKEFKLYRLIPYVFLFLLYGCPGPLIGSHSPVAYKNATSLKAEVIVILMKANTPFDENKNDVDAIRLKADQAYEYVKGLANNSLSTKQWEILKRPDGDLLGKFFKRWEERSTLSDDLISEYIDLTSKAFDQIICLEANKKEKFECINEKGD